MRYVWQEIELINGASHSVCGLWPPAPSGQSMHMTDFNEPESEALFVLLGLKLDVSGIQIAFKPFSLEMFMVLFLSEYFNIIFRD